MAWNPTVLFAAQPPKSRIFYPTAVTESLLADRVYCNHLADRLETLP